MKTLADEILLLSYEGEEIKELINRYKKTKKKRIKNKIFKKLIPLCVKEKGVLKLSDVVLMKYEVYEATMGMMEELKKQEEALKETPELSKT
ncbi:hypothetical protein U8V72_14770 [Priestia filamentosa]|uniref:hypothetical protein n=1 Tax=Priestia filamentosa TaxID=1402861 RepID=UPI00058931F8